MTSSLPRKPRTTSPAPAAATRTLSSLAALAALLAAPAAQAQYNPRPAARLAGPKPILLAPAPDPAPPAQPAAGPQGRPAGMMTSAYHFQKPAGPAPKVEAQFQVPAGEAVTGDLSEYQISLEPPGIERLFRADTEQELERRIQQEAKQRTVPERVAFPDKPVLSRVEFTGRQFPPSYVVPEAQYVNYHRLYTEQLNYERYGWSLGVVDPFLSATAFFKDVAFFPMHFGTQPCTRQDSSAGYCLPGDPVPLLWYPPYLDKYGVATETGFWLTLAFVFP